MRRRRRRRRRDQDGEEDNALFVFFSGPSPRQAHSQKIETTVRTDPQALEQMSGASGSAGRSAAPLAQPALEV
eukprot:9468227-Pyramimonas_sp.AAC.1